MASSSDPSRATNVRELPGFSTLFADYLDSHPDLADRFPIGFRSSEEWRRAAETAVTRDIDRDKLADRLLQQNRAWGMPEAVLRNAERLRDPETVAVVTGQQLGLFGGPLYTLYKTITSIQLAEEMERVLDRPVVPVFWVEGEDHDFQEIASIHLIKQNDLSAITLEDPRPPGDSGAVGRIRLNGSITGVADEVDATLAPSDFHPDLIALLKEAYEPGRLLEDAFVELWKALFADRGLVFMNPDDDCFKGMVGPLFEKDLVTGQEAVDAVMEAGASLRPKYHQQVTARPTNLFYLDESGRHAIDRSGNSFSLRGTSRTFSEEEIVAEVRERPERFSPNVILRPLMQDTVLPTAYYVAGPGEIAYFAQYLGVYEWAGVPMPGIYPRASATLVEPKVRKVLDRYELSLEELGRGVESSFARIVRETSGTGIEETMREFRSALNEGINRLKPEVGAVDKSLERSVEASRAGIMKELERLEERVFRAQKRQHDEVRAQVEKAAVNVLPHGKLQERVMSPLYFLNKFGVALVDRLFDELSLDTASHQVIDL